VREFIAERFTSTSELELLLLLRDNPLASWSAETAARQLRMPVPWAAGQLAAMHATGLLAEEAEDDRRYRYDPTAQLGRLVDGVAMAYRERKTRVVSVIFGEPTSDAQSFADAFRVRRRD